MSKVTMGAQTLLYPTPATLVGANVDGEANFTTVAWCGIVNSEPPMIAVALQHPRYTGKGIRQNLTFSVNIPSSDLVKETDYCGIISGSRVNKASVCRFTVFYGRLNTAPLIEQCPINLECEVAHILNLGSHALIIGSIEQTYVTESCLTGGKPDIDKIKPFAYINATHRQYQVLGEVIGEAFSIGKELKTGE